MQWPFAPENLPDDSYSSNKNASPMFSDGRYLYILSQTKAQTFRYFVDMYDPLQRMMHIKQVELRFPTGRSLKSKFKV